MLSGELARRLLLAAFVADRRQFCSRLIVQAYRHAGVNLVSDADFCHPGCSGRRPREPGKNVR
ncbi:hypothetical protein BTR19_29640 [Pseudomonas fluorescens]|uniref:Uncharacterized protein n=1 Tax=Pseudomonas azotoformans TaxID=47878 RepID=A0A4Q0HCM3_PSEAZ|nr:hypothetical protein BTR19_29640 [Pseudomonas fluorescens]PRW70432.1 hypothetical protein C7A09_03525 [Pseudomonas fluorescens]RXE46383.1 hypothetical protein B4O85_27440 [Pseudomonas azotoformans]